MLADSLFWVILQHHDHLDRSRQVEIRPDIVIRDASGAITAIADVKYKRPSTKGLSPEDVYQAVAYVTRYRLDRVALISAEPPPVTELHVGGIAVRRLSVDLSSPPPDREWELKSIAQELISA